jgi:hypothetical protein
MDYKDKGEMEDKDKGEMEDKDKNIGLNVDYYI